MEEDAWEKAKVLLILILIGLFIAGSEKNAMTSEQMDEMECLYRCKNISEEYYCKVTSAYQNREPLPPITTFDKIKKDIEKELQLPIRCLNRSSEPEKFRK